MVIVFTNLIGASLNKPHIDDDNNVSLCIYLSHGALKLFPRIRTCLFNHIIEHMINNITGNTHCCTFERE